jgi:uncharacterized protein YjbI with pentapeptide repeats
MSDTGEINSQNIHFIDRDGNSLVLIYGESWAGIDLGGACLKHADFHGACLKGTYFYYADLRGVNFAGSDLSYADFSWTDLSYANLANTNLTGVTFECALTKKVNTNGAIFKKTMMPDDSIFSGSLEMMPPLADDMVRKPAPDI